ncbi:D-allose-binding periplasmic protein [Brachyspira pilosicoli WesB]|uniref:D-allose-binding periplasmic protein n=1 Tax=Brachyspira pilosicoli WesB TaxID=1161918 RepID=K0JI94_BRAPL|nr:D-allose transporter substrate-binding protein [Brachyspira pilosicoli]CCG56644.1 D-allose-binding periplasmic protein [Brachyspira pilosicoli WesB]
MKKIIIMFLSILTIIGCSQGKSADNAGSAKSDGSTKYLMILKTLSSPFWINLQKGIEEEAAKLGVDVTILAGNSEDDIQGQLRLFEENIVKGYKGIGFAPISPVNLIPAASQAYAQGIFLVNVDEKVNMEQLKANNANVEGFVNTDNYKVGASAAKFIVDTIKSGDVLIIEGKAGNTSGEDRRMGATSVFTNTQGINLVASQPADWDRTKALDVTSSLLQRYPNVKAIYCCNDTMALGAQQAVENAQKTDSIIVVGTDGNPEAFQSIKEGRLKATMEQDSRQIGAIGLRMLVESVQSNTAPIAIDAEPKVVGLEAILVTKDNVDERIKNNQ